MDSVKHLKIFFLLLFLIGLLMPSSLVRAEGTDKDVEITGFESEEKIENKVETTNDNLPILYENGIHYIVDPNYPDMYLILYCMNNKSHWPHEQPSLGESVPNYKYGYLTPEQFESEAKYQECMQRLDEILFTGYPYNGNLLYKLVEDGEGDPIEAYTALYPDSYYVTEKQAYDATQNAVWKLLYDYGVEDNDLSDISSSNLAQIIYDNSRHSSILRVEPDSRAISIEGDSTFRNDPKDGKWHTGSLRITEPIDYYGVYYALDLPTGITVSGNNEFKGNEPFELVSDQMPAKNTEITIASEISWLKETRQYTPNPDKVVDGKRFQHMAGAVVMSKEARISFNCDVKQTADLTISKLVEGRMGDRTKKFPFTIYLHHENGTPFTGSVQTEGSVIDGYEGVCEAPTVGELVFDEQGKAIVELTHGQKLTIKDLPIGCQYQVSEPEEIHTEYKVTYNDNEEKPQGMLIQNVDIQVINRKDEVPETGIMDGKTGLMASIWMGVCSIAVLFSMSLRKSRGKRRK